MSNYKEVYKHVQNKLVEAEGLNKAQRPDYWVHKETMRITKEVLILINKEVMESAVSDED